MRPLNTLEMLILSAIYGKKDLISRYEAMSLVNKVAAEINHPYSPGATYHSIKGLTAKKMIDFNQEKVQITPSGEAAIRKHLVESAIPSSLADLLCRILSLQLCNDLKLRTEGTRRIQIEMIKYNQFSNKNDSDDLFLSDLNSAIESCRKEISKALSRIILDIGAVN